MSNYRLFVIDNKSSFDGMLVENITLYNCEVEYIISEKGRITSAGFHLFIINQKDHEQYHVNKILLQEADYNDYLNP